MSRLLPFRLSCRDISHTQHEKRGKHLTQTNDLSLLDALKE
jgi:hypothetical protein